jgi:phospholipid-translocating ATPase
MRSSYLRPYRAVERWYEKAAAFNVETVFSRKRPSAPRRTIFVNENLPVEYLDPKGRVLKDYVYDTNQVITSKYTVLTFAPRNILEQFRRVANVSVRLFPLQPVPDLSL